MHIIDVDVSDKLYVYINFDSEETVSSESLILIFECTYESLPCEVNCFEQYSGHYTKFTGEKYIEDFGIESIYFSNMDKHNLIEYLVSNINDLVKISEDIVLDLIKDHLNEFTYTKD